MKIALVNTFEVKDIKNWSGIPFHLSVFFESVFGESNIDFISIPLKRNIYSYLKGFYFNRIKKRNYLSDFDNDVLSANYKAFEDLRNKGYDLIITFQFFIIPNIKNDKSKIIFWSDATFQNLLNFYSYVSNLPPSQINNIHLLQKKALQLSDLIIFSSQWAIDSAVGYYQTAPEKLQMIPFASNLSVFPDKEEINNIIAGRNEAILKLLFIGIDWDRKGGEEAVAVLNSLNKKGIKTILYVVGADVPLMHKGNTDIISLGFINKNIAGGEKEIISLLKKCSFLILPTKADCTPVVFSEANSYGLPVVSTLVGGISSVINNGLNGHYFESEVFLNEAALFIEKNWQSKAAYRSLCINSYKYYLDKLCLREAEKSFKMALNELYRSEAV